MIEDSEVRLDLGDDGVLSIPFVSIVGEAGDGPLLTVIAGVHGTEYTSIAAAVTKWLIKGSDYLIDLHAGDLPEAREPRPAPASRRGTCLAPSRRSSAARRSESRRPPRACRSSSPRARPSAPTGSCSVLPFPRENMAACRTRELSLSRSRSSR
jgi:hypothetical protein